MPQSRLVRNSQRLGLIDVLRGLAVLQMIVFHFIWDLDYFGWIDVAMNRDAPWTLWRAAIVTQFLLLVGVSLVLRAEFKPSGADFWKRWAQIAAAAALVSVGSALLFGERFIYFGILHFVAAALLLSTALLRLKVWLIPLGLLAVALGNVLSHEFFTPPGWNVLGFATAKPRTEDYVPLFPWLGVVWVGAGLASIWQAHHWRRYGVLEFIHQHPPRLLRWLGSWPLLVYLAHQPLLMGVLQLIKRWA